MPDITIIKLKIRRGTNDQRKNVVLEQGELGYVTNTNIKRVYIGDGTTTGGIPIGTKVHTPRQIPGSRVDVYSEINDVVYDTSMLFQLTASDYTNVDSWACIGTVPDNSTIEYDGANILRLKNNGITGDKFASNAVFSQGGLTSTVSNGLSANVDGNYIKIISNKITLDNVDENIISSSALGNGLSGGDGELIFVNANEETFSFTDGVLDIQAVPPSTVSTDSFDPAIIGGGLYIESGQLKTNIQTANSDQFIVGPSKELELKAVVPAGVTMFDNFEYNEYGQVISVDSAILDTLSGNDNHNQYFNGVADQVSFIDQTIYSVVSTDIDDNTHTLSLSSAGFIVIDSSVGKVAVPIFKFE